MRPSNEDLLMETARVWAKRSTCSRLSVGAVIARETRILSQGYNGAPAGLPHCDHTSSGSTGFGLDTGGCLEAVHAEANAIAWAARQGIRTDGAALYCTHQPCLKCAQLIVNAGIVAVYYEERYRDDAGLTLLADAGVWNEIL